MKITESIIGVRNGFNRQFILSEVPEPNTLEIYFTAPDGKRQKLNHKFVSDTTIEIDYEPHADENPMADYETVK